MGAVGGGATPLGAVAAPMGAMAAPRPLSEAPLIDFSATSDPDSASMSTLVRIKVNFIQLF